MERLQLMWASTQLLDGAEVAYGFGWFVGHVAGRPAVYHGGNWQGFVASITRFTDDDLTVVVLANRSGSSGVLGGITEEVFTRYRPDVDLAPPVPPDPIDLSQEELHSYVGHYWLSDGGALEFGLAPEGLTVSGAGAAGLVLRPYDTDSFFLGPSPLRFIFIRDQSSNAVTGFRNHNGTLRGRKIR